MTDQDKRIAGYAHENGRGMVIAVNKWDEALNRARREKDLTGSAQLSSTERQQMIATFTEDVRHELIFANYAPVVFISALKRRGIDDLLNTIVEISEQHAMRIQTSELNRLIADATFEHPTHAEAGN